MSRQIKLAVHAFVVSFELLLKFFLDFCIRVSISISYWSMKRNSEKGSHFVKFCEMGFPN
jgi:hypothetical protein